MTLSILTPAIRRLLALHRERIVLFALASALVVLGLGARYYGPAGLRNASGAILYEVFWVTVLQALWPRASTLRLCIVVFAGTCGIELLQLCNHPWLVAARSTLPGRLLLGAQGGFDPIDFLWYAVGSTFAWFPIRGLLRIAGR